MEFTFRLYDYSGDGRLNEDIWYGNNVSGFKLVSHKNPKCPIDCGQYMNVSVSMGNGSKPNVIGIKKVPNHDVFEISVLKDGGFKYDYIKTKNTSKVYLLNDIVVIDQMCEGNKQLQIYNITQGNVSTNIVAKQPICGQTVVIDDHVWYYEKAKYFGLNNNYWIEEGFFKKNFNTYYGDGKQFTGFYKVHDLLPSELKIHKNLYVQFLRNDTRTTTSTQSTTGTTNTTKDASNTTSTSTTSSDETSGDNSTVSTTPKQLPNEATTILSDSELAASHAANLLETCSLTKVLYDYHNVLDIDVLQYEYENGNINVNYYKNYLTTRNLTSTTIPVNESMTLFVAFLAENGQDPTNFYFSHVAGKETKIYSHINNTITLLAKTETGQALVLHDRIFTYDCNDKYYLYAFDGTRFMPLWNRDDFDCAYQVSTGDEFRIFVTKGHICMSAVPEKTVTRFKECEFFKFNYFTKARLAQTRFLSLYYIASMAECGLSLSDNEARSIFIRFILKPKKMVKSTTASVKWSMLLTLLMAYWMTV
ncbi:unnamed protein product [Bursaphelenchus okinawaensis]|uniref:Uncharacterized protein n=1 Tax=Bursaphelenchus okinawaensis TaxID=465554 RepID=A0A811KDU4_9BILA|nr:unnamed protein product [Bursaphelenchus okinawaensis]CAG9101763.1 unnamed protein product [Bursaphelenchus okinawaensis]